MVVGLPLWLLAAFVLAVWIGLAIRQTPDIGPIELEHQPLSIPQLTVLWVATIAYFLAYPSAFFWAYRITRHPWIVFAAMLAPVLAFCYAVACFSIADSNFEQMTWLTYLGSLALLLAAGSIAASFPGRAHTSHPTTA